MVSGVPQGSIRPFSSSQSYVDDTKLIFSFQVKDKPDAITVMQNDLLQISKWCSNNFLLLNPGKTKLMVFGSKQSRSKLDNFCVPFMGRDLVPEHTTKDLGVTLDSNLTFGEHVIETVSSCMSLLGKISRTKHTFDKRTLLTIINTQALSKIFYRSNVWANTS